MSIYGISGTRHISQSLSESDETHLEPEPFIYDEDSAKCTEPQPMSQDILDNPVIDQPVSQNLPKLLTLDDLEVMVYNRP